MQVRASPHQQDSFDDVQFECSSSFNWNSGNPNVYVNAPMKDPWNPNSVCAGGYETSGTQLTMYGDVQPRMFFKKNDGSVLRIDMRTDTISWWQDVSLLGAGYNGALYTTWTNHADDAAVASARYCDANDGVGNGLWCPEFDLGESNACGFHTTSHACVHSDWPIYCNMDAGSVFPGFCGQYCDRGGQDAFTDSSKPQVYGPHVWSGINTRKPYEVQVDFGYTDANLDFTLTLKQDAFSWSMKGSNDNKLWPHGYPADGKMALLAQLWNTSTASAMEWLAGPACTQTSNPDASKVTFKMWDIRVNGKLIKFKNVTRGH